MEENKVIKVKIPDTKYWLLSEQLPDKKWNIFVVNYKENEKSLARTEVETKHLSIMIETVLKQKFPYFKIVKYKELRKEIEQMPIYDRWRNEVLVRCNNKCQMCNINNNLEVHHRDSFYSILKRNCILSLEQAFECKELWDINNGEVLCAECHEKMESSKKMKELNQ